MSDLRVYVKDKDGKEMSFVVHYSMGCRLVSAIDESTGDLESLLKKAYEFDKGIYDVKACMDNESNYKIEVEYARKHGLNLVALKPYPNKEAFDAGIIEIDFTSRTIVSNQSGDYICHRGIRETWGYTGDHLDAGRFKHFNIPEYWAIVDEYFFGKPVKIEGDVEKEIERRLCERVK